MSQSFGLVKFNGLNYADWSEQIRFQLGAMNLDQALVLDEKPAAITETSSKDERSHYDDWERSNRLCLSLMRLTIAENVKPLMPKTEDAKEFMMKLKECSHSDITDKSVVGSLMKKWKKKDKAPLHRKKWFEKKGPCKEQIPLKKSSNKWTEDLLSCPIISWPETGEWMYHDVVPHAGNLWWVDLAKGLLFCNPTDYHPTMRFVELPNTIQLKERAERLERIDCYRMVREVAGRLRFADVARRPGVNSYASTMVVVWTLTVEMSSGAASWQRVMTTLADIWEDESYRRTGMPAECVPELALMHPTKPDVVYFFLMHYLFGVDVRHGVVVDFARDSLADLVNPVYANPRPPLSWRYVLTWVLPPSLRNALGDDHHSSEGCESSLTSSDLTDK
ncbi:hypothetical protein ACP70R_027322 [Stipagrostis hirtigluma subsp. patula]